MKNEALRLFLAMTALILTALLTNPVSNLGETEGTEPARTVASAPTKKAAPEKKKAKATRTFAFYFRR